MKRLSVDFPTGKEKNIKINKQIRRIIFLFGILWQEFR
jgi:hypothetical protein